MEISNKWEMAAALLRHALRWDHADEETLLTAMREIKRQKTLDNVHTDGDSAMRSDYDIVCDLIKFAERAQQRITMSLQEFASQRYAEDRCVSGDEIVSPIEGNINQELLTRGLPISAEGATAWDCIKSHYGGKKFTIQQVVDLRISLQHDPVRFARNSTSREK